MIEKNIKLKKGYDYILKIEYGDITEQNTDAIVNSANPTLLGGGGIDGLVHYKAGEGLYKECLRLRENKDFKNGIEQGNAVITNGYNLKAKYIIHTHGPVCREYKDDTWKNILENCYINCLEIADENNCKSISFPLIGNGIFCCDVNLTSIIALNTIKNYFLYNDSNIKEVRIIIYLDKEFNLKDEKNFEAYSCSFNKIYK